MDSPPDNALNRSSGTRKRIALACNSCRSKRVKCDGAEPACSTCQSRLQSCDYTHENNRKRPSNAYIQALEARVAVLERLLALRTETSRLTPPIESENGPIIGDTQSHIYKPDAAQPSSDRNTNQDEVEAIVDALGCFTIGDTGELSFFGGASNFSLIRDHALKISSSADARQRGIIAARMSPKYYEPSDELRNHLLEVFFRWQNSWQRYIHTEPFVLDLFVHKTGKYCTPLLLNSVLAMASRFSHRPEIQSTIGDHNTSGMVFASQAIAMLQCECEAPTTSTVQATSLLGLYLASSDNEGLGFMYVGMAARMAMNLGLHLDCSYYAARGMISENDIQVRHVAFWGLHALDKFYCLGMGRPAGIQENNITVPQPRAQDADLTLLPPEIARIVSPWPESHVVEALKKLSEVFIITSAVLDQLYAQVPNWSRQQRDDRVMQTHLSLMRSLETLPKTLKFSDSGLQPAPPYVYQLHLQYHQSTILMHRPFLKVLYPAQGTVEYTPETLEIHSKSCQHAAIKIANIFRIFHLNYTCRNMPVSAVHPGFTAAIIHMLDLKTGSPKAQKQAARHLSTLLKCLYDMNANWNWANRSLRGIHSLARQWKIEAWLEEALIDIDPGQKQSYEKYTSSEHVNVRVPGIFDPEGYEAPVAPLEDIFDSWTVDALLDNVFPPDQLVSF